MPEKTSGNFFLYSASSSKASMLYCHCPSASLRAYPTIPKPFFSNLILSPRSTPPRTRTLDDIFERIKGGILSMLASCPPRIHASSACATRWPKYSCSGLTLGVSSISTSSNRSLTCPTTVASVPMSGFCITSTSLPMGYSSSMAAAAFSSCRRSFWEGASLASCTGKRRLSPSNCFTSSPRAVRTIPLSVTTSRITRTSPTSTPRLLRSCSRSLRASRFHLSAASGEWGMALSLPSFMEILHAASETALTTHSLR
mmetsp:Transcript_34594/g.85085  ORF Transcript_34594/g.85085 Transcript_34594/m.85085 type:complete len:256 (+) Transcript_34594:734-1501(+)